MAKWIEIAPEALDVNAAMEINNSSVGMSVMIYFDPACQPPPVPSREIGVYVPSLVALDDLVAGLLIAQAQRQVAMQIEMSCGSFVEYATRADIPRVSTPCPCGDRAHWLIQIGGWIPLDAVVGFQPLKV